MSFADQLQLQSGVSSLKVGTLCLENLQGTLNCLRGEKNLQLKYEADVLHSHLELEHGQV